MSIDASKLLTEDKFWDIIENSDEGRNLSDSLVSLSNEELIGFDYWWQYFSNRLYRQDLWAVAYVVKGGCSDDSFDYFRFWLLTQGRKPVTDALVDADSLCELFEMIDLDDEDCLENEEVNYTVIDVIEERSEENDGFRKLVEECEMPDFTVDMDFEWDEDDEDSIRKICPRTFDRYWNNFSSNSIIKPTDASKKDNQNAINDWYDNLTPAEPTIQKKQKGLVGFLKRLFK